MFNIKALVKELEFKAIRSSGRGGQHVNKVSSKIELRFNLLNSVALNQEQKELLLKSLENRLSLNAILILHCDVTRSQHTNKTLAIQRFLKLLEDGLKVRRTRKPTKVPRAVKQKRLNSKRKNAEKKADRRPPKID